MDILRITPQPNLLIVSKVTEDDEPRELIRITITGSEQAKAEISKLVSWAINMQVPIEIPAPEGALG